MKKKKKGSSFTYGNFLIESRLENGPSLFLFLRWLWTCVTHSGPYNSICLALRSLCHCIRCDGARKCRHWAKFEMIFMHQIHLSFWPPKKKKRRPGFATLPLIDWWTEKEKEQEQENQRPSGWFLPVDNLIDRIRPSCAATVAINLRFRCDTFSNELTKLYLLLLHVSFNGQQQTTRHNQ